MVCSAMSDCVVVRACPIEECFLDREDIAWQSMAWRWECRMVMRCSSYLGTIGQVDRTTKKKVANGIGVEDDRKRMCEKSTDGVWNHIGGLASERVFCIVTFK